MIMGECKGKETQGKKNTLGRKSWGLTTHFVESRGVEPRKDGRVGGGKLISGWGLPGKEIGGERGVLLTKDQKGQKTARQLPVFTQNMYLAHIQPNSPPRSAGGNRQIKKKNLGGLQGIRRSRRKPCSGT